MFITLTSWFSPCGTKRDTAMHCTALHHSDFPPLATGWQRVGLQITSILEIDPAWLFDLDSLSPQSRPLKSSNGPPPLTSLSASWFFTSSGPVPHHWGNVDTCLPVATPICSLLKWPCVDAHRLYYFWSDWDRFPGIHVSIQTQLEKPQFRINNLFHKTTTMKHLFNVMNRVTLAWLLVIQDPTNIKQ